MTTKSKGITLPVYNNIRLSNGYFETSTSLDFSANASYKYSPVGVAPVSQIAPQLANPQPVTVQSQDANSLFGAPGGAINLTAGVGSTGAVSGNVVIKDSAGNGATWNTTHLQLGSWHFWIDSANRLRQLNGTPATQGDGNVVGIDLSASAVYDPPSLADGAGITTTVACAGAVLGDFALASFSLDLQSITVTAWVSAAAVVSVRFQNESGSVIDLASGTLRVKVIKQ